MSNAKRVIPFGKPIIGDEERNAVLEVLSGTQLVHGPRAKQFEQDFVSFVGGGYATSVASCTAGLHLAYFNLGIGPGDEVIVPAQTHVATAHAVEYTGAKPVFVDAEETTGNIDIAQIEAAINQRTRAISIVHYLGLPVDMDAINTIAKKHDLFVVEDCALAIGSRFRGTHAGLLGDVGAYSFYPVKHITTAEGGMVLTRHQSVKDSIERKKAFGLDRTVAERTIPGVYDVNMLGYNYRMNELEAALGIEQLKRVPGILERRSENAKTLRAELASVPQVRLLVDGDADRQHSNYCLSAILDNAIAPARYEIIMRLKSLGVGTSIYYPVAVPHLTYYREKYQFKATEYPIATLISERSIALPVGAHLEGEEMRYIAASLKTAIEEQS